LKTATFLDTFDNCNFGGEWSVYPDVIDQDHIGKGIAIGDRKHGMNYRVFQYRGMVWVSPSYCKILHRGLCYPKLPNPLL